MKVGDEIPLRVVIYQEDGEWIAHLLEMDLVGSGDTPEEAEAELAEAFAAQITFCIQKGISPWRPAPRKYFTLWNKIQEERLTGAFGEAPARSERMVSSMSYRSSDRRKYLRRAGFEMVGAG